MNITDPLSTITPVFFHAKLFHKDAYDRIIRDKAGVPTDD